MIVEDSKLNTENFRNVISEVPRALKYVQSLIPGGDFLPRLRRRRSDDHLQHVDLLRRPLLPHLHQIRNGVHLRLGELDPLRSQYTNRERTHCPSAWAHKVSSIPKQLGAEMILARRIKLLLPCL